MQVKPSVLHGDLWSGNISGVDGEPSIFDPAVYYGHSEADFGMSWCAGFSSVFYDAYHRVLPKAPGQALALCSRDKVGVYSNCDGSLLRRQISLSAFVSLISNVLLRVQGFAKARVLLHCIEQRLPACSVFNLEMLSAFDIAASGSAFACYAPSDQSVTMSCLCPAGFEDRKQLYLLYHYLNHYNLFGGGYYSSAEGILRSLSNKI